MPKRVLWLDNDPEYITYYVRAMRDRGYEVSVKTSVTQAEEAIEGEGPYDLLIMDVMIPSMSEEEERLYPPEQTDLGLKMGLVFYRRLKPRLDSAGTKVLAMTIRLDEEVQNEFAAAGLPESGFTRKIAVRKVPDFLAKVDELIGDPQ